MTALLDAARACLVPLSAPAPSVACTGLQGDGASYEVSYSVPTSESLGVARTEMLGQIHRHLRHAGIALAVAGVAHLGETTVPTPADILGRSDLFGMLGAEERDLLAKHFEEIWLQPGATLFQEGEMPKFLFLVASGVVEITKTGPEGSRVLHRMSPGESLGAIGLITGQAYAATAKALTPVKLFRLDKGAIGAAIAAAPQLAAGMEELAQRSQAALARDAAAHQDHQVERPDELRFKLRNFLRLLGT
jgi:CRP-like cAMP-binding protein